MSERRIPVMPMATHDIAVDAWHRSVRTEARVDLAVDEILEIRGGMLKLSGEIAGFATEAQRDRLTAQDERRDMRRQMNALTHSIREVRKSTSGASDEDVRKELPTLPEIMVEFNQKIVAEANAAIARHSESKKLRRYDFIEKTFKDGVGEAVKHAVLWISMGILGWLVHDILTIEHGKKTEPVPITAPAPSR
jgi:hypothetical protein